MDAQKPGSLPLKPGMAPSVGPAAPAAPRPAPAPAVPVRQSSVVRSTQAAQSLRPAPLAPASTRANTVFSSRVQKFWEAKAPQELPAAGAFKSMGSIRSKHAELQEHAIGEKGMRADKVAEVLDFMEAVARSGSHIREEHQRASLTQILQFWTRQVTPLMDRGPQMALLPFAAG